MFGKDDKTIQLALSMSPEDDAEIVRGAEQAEAERLHRLAMNPEATIRQECGIPRR